MCVCVYVGVLGDLYTFSDRHIDRKAKEHFT